MSGSSIIDALIVREGGFVDNPADKGGPTCWGITEHVARACGYAGDMRTLPRGFAAAIYANDYINVPGFDKISAVSSAIGEEMIDTGVNMGVTWPGVWLQRILNVLNRQARDFPDLTVDGQIGPATVSALRAVLERRGSSGEKVILRALNCLQGARYLEITEARAKNEEFYFGWLLNRVEVK